MVKKKEKEYDSIDTEIYTIVVYRVLDGKISSGKLHEAKTKGRGRTDFLYNTDPADETFQKLAFPRSKNLKYSQDYPTLKAVEKEIEKIKKILEEGNLGQFEEENEIGLEDKFFDLHLLQQAYLFPKDRSYVQYPNGRPTLYYGKIGSVFVPMCFSANTFALYVAPDIAIENAQILDLSISEDYPDKENNSWFTLDNLKALGFIVLLIVFSIGSFKAYNVEAEMKEPLQQCRVDLGNLQQEFHEARQSDFNNKISQFDKILEKMNVESEVNTKPQIK